MTRRRAIAGSALLTTAGLLASATPAAAAATTGHVPLVTAGILGSIFGGIGHAILGAFTWTIGLASKFILTTIGALVRMLIPRSWATQGVQIMEWIVAVPNYAGTVTSPTGQSVYGFAGINALRDLFTWIGVGLLPLTLLYGTTRAMLGEARHVAVPLARVLGITALLVSYPYWWTQTAALTDSVTHMVLTLPQVATGLHQLMLYAVDGVALGGWQLVDLALMAFVAIELLSLIFMKVAIILLGALLYATGPITIGLVATDSGSAIARAWASAVAMLVALPIVWATLFAVGALLIGDAGTAGPLIAGHTSVGGLLGGALLAGAGAASLWMCLRAAREAMGLLRMQLGGLLALSHRGAGGSRSASTTPHATAATSLRRFGTRVSQGAGGAVGQLAASGAGGAATVRAGRAVGYVGRNGAIGTAAAGTRLATSAAASRGAALVGRSRAGAVAVRMAKAGTAGWYAQANASGVPSSAGRRGTGDPGHASKRGGSTRSSAAHQSTQTNGKTQSASPAPYEPTNAGAARDRSPRREETPSPTRPAAAPPRPGAAERDGPAPATSQRTLKAPARSRDDQVGAGRRKR
jgi:hypothetical protein